MIIKAPEEITNIEWEDELELETISKSVGPPHSTSKKPTVSIGELEKWNIADLYQSDDEIPPSLRTKLDEADFYIVQLACSFRPVQNKVKINNAWFEVDLLPDSNNNQPIAFDLCPRRVEEEVKHKFQFTINPSLKFAEVVQGSLGSVGWGREYSELQPKIITYGLQEKKASWEYRETKGKAIEGCKAMYLLLKVPKEMREVKANIKLTAKLQGRGVGLGRYALWHYNQRDRKTSKEIKLI